VRRSHLDAPCKQVFRQLQSIEERAPAEQQLACGQALNQFQDLCNGPGGVGYEMELAASRQKRIAKARDGIGTGALVTDWAARRKVWSGTGAVTFVDGVTDALEEGVA